MRVDVGGVGISFEVTGEGRPVVLLHGFPDSGRLWRHQVPALVEAGFQTIVPDLRGYGLSDRPPEVEAYSIPFLVGDVLGILDHLGIEKPHLVGHDWGAALAWAMASLVPDRVDHLVALSVGHPLAFRAVGLEQQEKSWYMLLFQFSPTAELWLSNDNWANARTWSHHPDIDAVIADLLRTESLTPALNYYRANVPPEVLIGPPLELPPVQAPTLGVWGSADFALTEAQMTGSADYVAGPFRYDRIDGAGHWLQLEVPETINRLLLDFLDFLPI